MNNCSDCNYKAKNEDEKARPNCAVIGVYNHPQASIAAYYALHALQHRGQEASGITTIYYDEVKKKNKYAFHRGEGLVLDVFGKSEVLNERLKGTSAVGHNRYSTTGGASSSNIQPFNMIYQSGILSLAHNGNLTNTKELKQRLQAEGAIFQTTTDSELFMHLFAKSKEVEIKDQILDTLRTVRGAYSLCIITEKGLFAARDPHGVRPLSLGKLNVDGNISYIVASETAAFDILSAEYIRSIEHNELIHIDEDTIKTGVVKSYQIESEKPVSKHCIFEYVYFSRPDSLIFGTPVDKVRRKLGKNLALESPVELDNPNDKINVIAVPDSGNTATLGFAKINNEKVGNSDYEIGLIRSHYVGRTFISPGQNNRELKVKTKFNTVKGIIEGRNVVVVDDSIVRGTTSKSLIKLIREAKPKKLHMRITSPPVKYPCHYGMDFPSKEELIANHYESHEDIGNAIGVDSLSYLSLDQLLASVPQEEGIGYCTACFDGNYPIALDDETIEIRDNE
jgi:amidophosphoribosyltransferase